MVYYNKKIEDIAKRIDNCPYKSNVTESMIYSLSREMKIAISNTAECNLNLAAFYIYKFMHEDPIIIESLLTLVNLEHYSPDEISTIVEKVLRFKVTNGGNKVVIKKYIIYLAMFTSDNSEYDLKYNLSYLRKNKFFNQADEIQKWIGISKYKYYVDDYRNKSKIYKSLLNALGEVKCLFPFLFGIINAIENKDYSIQILKSKSINEVYSEYIDDINSNKEEDNTLIRFFTTHLSGKEEEPKDEPSPIIERASSINLEFEEVK